MGSQSYRFYTAVLSALLIVTVSSEAPSNNQVTKKIDVSEGKLKRQNEAPGSGRGEEVDLSTVSVNQPGTSGGVPQQPGQTPFFGGGGNPFLQQPFFGNGLGYPGIQQSGFAAGQQPTFPGQQAGFPGQQAGFPGQQPGFPGFSIPQGYPQFNYPTTGTGKNVILQNNGKQYLVQELTDQQRVVQKNGKQYLLQPYAASPASAIAGGLQTFNVPNSVLAGLGSPLAQSGALGTLGALSSLSGASDGSLNYPGNVFSPSRLQSAPQRVILNGNGQQLAVDQLPIRSGASPYLSPTGGQQYAGQYAPFGLPNGLSLAYSRANEAGYGLYASGRQGLDPAGETTPSKRYAVGISNEKQFRPSNRI